MEDTRQQHSARFMAFPGYRVWVHDVIAVHSNESYTIIRRANNLNILLQPGSELTLCANIEEVAKTLFEELKRDGFCITTSRGEA